MLDYVSALLNIGMRFFMILKSFSKRVRYPPISHSNNLAVSFYDDKIEIDEKIVIQRIYSCLLKGKENFPDTFCHRV